MSDAMKHVAAHAVKEIAQGAGCMVTLCTMLSGITLVALVVFLFV